MAVNGRCMKCKENRDMVDAEEVTMKNNKRAFRGTCSVCGGKMFKIAAKTDSL